MRHYEVMVVLSPMISPDEASQAWERIKGFITNREADIVHEERWGTRRLAYPVKKGQYQFLEGNYHLTRFTTEASFNIELENYLKLDELVLRSLVITTLSEEELAAHTAPTRAPRPPRAPAGMPPAGAPQAGAQAAPAGSPAADAPAPDAPASDAPEAAPASEASAEVAETPVAEAVVEAPAADAPAPAPETTEPTPAAEAPAEVAEIPVAEAAAEAPAPETTEPAPAAEEPQPEQPSE